MYSNEESIYDLLTLKYLIYRCDINTSKNIDVRFFQNKLGKTVLICRLLQLLVPLEVTDLLQGDNAIKEPRKQTAEKNSSTERRFNTIA